MKYALPILCAVALVGVAGCDVEQTREAEMPEVDVDVETEPGQMPAYDVDWADVNVGTTTKTVTVPKLVVVTEEVEVEVPYIDVSMPGEDPAEYRERTITVEIELEGEAHELDIQQIYGTGERLIVVSRLEPTGQDLGDERIRVSDRVVVNTPDLDVRHYIIGDRPEGDWNTQYEFVSSRAEIEAELAEAQRIYSTPG